VPQQVCLAHVVALNRVQFGNRSLAVRT
jgi:hypothetical protein